MDLISVLRLFFSLFSAVFIYDLFHLRKLFFHIFYQFELCMGTVQILIVPCGLEVMVSFQIIGEETHAALKGHHHGSGGQIVQFNIGQCSAAAFNKAFDIELIEVQIAPDL